MRNLGWAGGLLNMEKRLGIRVRDWRVNDLVVKDRGVTSV